MHRRNKFLAILFGATAGASPFSSSLIASVEDEGAAGGGAAGGGAIDPAAASGAPAGTPAASAAPVSSGERTFTQADLDRIVADRLARDRAARGGVTPSAPPAPPPVAADRGGLTLAQRQDLLEQQTTFYRELSRTGVKLTEEQESDVFQLFRAAKPERPGEWLTRKVQAFNLGAQPQPTAASPVTATTTPAAPAAAGTTPSAPAPAAPAAAANGSAPNGVDAIATGGLVDVSRLSQQQIAQLGPQGVRRELEKVLASNQGRDGRPTLPPALRPKA